MPESSNSQTIEMPAIEKLRRLPDPERDSRHQRWRGGLYFVIWTLIGVLTVGPSVIQRATDGEEIPWTHVVSNFLSWYLWGLLFPLIWWWTRRLPFARQRWLRWLGFNLVLGLVVSLVYVSLNLIKDDLLANSFSSQRALNHLTTGIWYYMLVYFAIVAVVHAITYYERLRERELAFSRLESQIAKANLQMLRMQLHPHFLFNSLNAVSALMHRDVDAADRMISQLSDLLRMALEKDDRHQARLESELEFLHRYLAIEQIRFRDRLKVQIEVEPDCLAAQVPRLILQPLVENSIRHGIAMRSAAGRITIRAARSQGRLELMVADDGPGLPPERKLRLGVGLTNTRDRLAQLYGDEYSLELMNADEGGFEVHVRIPYELEPRILD